MNLREMTADFAAYMNAETDEEIAAALADITAGQIEEKAENYCWFLRDMAGDIEKFKTEEARLSAARKAMENKQKRVKEYMLSALESAGIAKLAAGTFKVSIQANPPALDVIDASLTPAEYKVIIPAREEADTARIKEALKNGEEVEGYQLTRGSSLRIR